MITPERRLEIETLIYKTFDTVDKSGANSQYYKEIFAKMTDAQFFTFLKRRLPFRFHTSVFKVEPNMSDIFASFNNVLKKPLLEEINMPYMYKDANGNPVRSKKCLVVYMNIKRMKQMRIHKTNTAVDIGKRDMKTGRLLGEDKGGLESNKEFEGAAALGLEYTIIENARIKADAMKAKAEAYNAISTMGTVSFNDIDANKTDSIAKNTMNVYLIGCNLHSNLVDDDYYTPHTLNRKKNSMRDTAD